ncbi:MAG: hypothetical protein IT365_08520 [Candidatus Hydrogenedentes bacterium]|nr:hypothetical protein [Candidatus Hydrogenedentota bacterium]
MRVFLIGWMCAAWIAGATAHSQEQAASNGTLTERFANPPADARILKIVHMLPDAPEAQDALLKRLLESGFGGMATNVSFEGYLESEEKWASLMRVLDEAKKAGMSLWLYDEKGYPSGNAGGLTMRDNLEWEARGRLIADLASNGGPASLNVPPGALVRAAAFHTAGGVLDLEDATDLSDFITDGVLNWEAPEGEWCIMVITEDFLYEGTHAAVSLADKLPYINLLMPEPTARFLEVTHAAYAKRLGDDLGKWFVATFTDEPSLMSLYFKRQDWRVIPWSPGLPGEFEKRRGYALEPLLPALVADAGPKGRAARYDYWLTVGELVSEDYFGQIRDWCRPRNIQSGGHLLLEEPLLMHVPLYGDFFRCIRNLDAPSMDCLTSIPEEVPWYVARLIGSAADLEGRAVTMSETSDHSQRYRPKGDERPVRVVTEDEIRGTMNRQLVNGINTFTSYYSFDGLSTEQLIRINEWTGRCATALRGGCQVSEIALLYPIESAWVHFAPAHRMVEDSPVEARRIEQIYRAAAEDLSSSGRDFTFVDSQALVEGRVENGALHYGNFAWRVIVLPSVDTLPLQAWKNLALFEESGGVVIALSWRPANSEKEFPSQDVQTLANDMFGAAADGVSTRANAAGGGGVFLPRGSEGMLPDVLDAILGRDVHVGDAKTTIRATHRSIDGSEIYFLINDSAQPWQGHVSLAAQGAGERLDPATGAIAPLAGTQDIAVELGPYGGVLFRFDDAAPIPRTPLTKSGFGEVRWLSMPEVTPSVGKGEFVRGEIGAIAQTDSPLTWEAKAVLTKGDVDTFLFATFDYPQPVDLSQAAFLHFTTAVPPGQRASTRLLVILRDTRGVEYLGETAHALNDGSSCQSYLRLSQFHRAGWSTEPAGPLDLSAINAIRVGWGGYLGREGETVDFAFAAPKAGGFVQ